MNKQIDLSKFNIHTDLAIDYPDLDNSLEGVKIKIENVCGLNITRVDLDRINALKKKKGKYITIEFDDITDSNNEEKVTKVLIEVLKKLIPIKNKSLGLIVGLGNSFSTPDSLGPLTIDNIIVTNHIYELNLLSKNYNRICAIKPGVRGETGIETKDIIESIVKKIKPDYLIIIDSLSSSSIERLNKTIQITTTGIEPGSGIDKGGSEISSDTLHIPVYAIGVPTVASASVIVKDTINFIYKSYEFNKEYMKKSSSKLSVEVPNYLKKEITESKNDKKKLLGFLGILSDDELQKLLSEVLNPIGYNYMVTPKEIDFIVKKMSSILSNAINCLVHHLDKVG